MCRARQPVTRNSLKSDVAAGPVEIDPLYLFQEASNVLLTALDTLRAVDRVTPLPLVLAREAIEQAKAKNQSHKTMAQALVKTAKKETERAKELGYAGRDPEYAALNTDISNLEKQLKGNEDATSVFAKLEDRLSAFLKRQSQQERRWGLQGGREAPNPQAGPGFNSQPGFLFL